MVVLGAVVKPNSTKKTGGKRRDAPLTKQARALRDDPEWDQAHSIPDAEDNPRLKAMNEVFRAMARRKIN